MKSQLEADCELTKELSPPGREKNDFEEHSKCWSSIKHAKENDTDKKVGNVESEELVQAKKIGRKRRIAIDEVCSSDDIDEVSSTKRIVNDTDKVCSTKRIVNDIDEVCSTKRIVNDIDEVSSTKIIIDDLDKTSKSEMMETDSATFRNPKSPVRLELDESDGTKCGDGSRSKTGYKSSDLREKRIRVWRNKAQDRSGQQ